MGRRLFQTIYGNLYKNIEPCPQFSAEITNTYGDKPNPDQKFTFIKNCFTILQSNLMNSYDRKTYEAVAIAIKKPKLNAQVFHRKVSII